MPLIKPPYLTDYQYYENEGVNPEDKNWGSYQYVSLKDVVNNFLLMYSGNTSLVNNEERYKILFHAKRAIQELNYDAFREIRILQLTVPQNLIYVMPPDYVNWVRVSLYKDGWLRPLTENIQTLTSRAYLQDNVGKILFDQDGYALEPQHSNFDLDRLTKQKKSIYLNQGNEFHGQMGWNVDGRWFFEVTIGGNYGLNTETANFNPTFYVDRPTGSIHFDSSMVDESVILEYVSDGMQNGDISKVKVNKLFEQYIYAAIKYEILNSKFGVQEYIVNRVRKERQALLRNAKLRISNMHPGRLLMNLRGLDKVIK
jgi:hypothetical protein